MKDIQTIWNNCLKIIRDNINEHSFKTWFEPIKPVKIENNILTIQVPSPFYFEWLEEHYIDLLRKTIKKELGANGQLEYNIIMDRNFGNNEPLEMKLPSTNKKALKNSPVSIPIDINKGKSRDIPNPFAIPGLKKININPQLVETFSFDNFIEGDCNRLARSAGFAVANNPGKTAFNPLLIYSPTGLGKTHLAHAIGIQTKNNFPEKTVLYVQTEQFGNQFIDAVKNNSMNDFVHFYQMIDLLIMDDIHTLSNKLKTQDVFFHIFNHLHQNGKQLIITSDKPPVEFQGIEPRLLSRFKWGLAADLQPPDLETRIAIIEKKLYNNGSTMPQDVVEHLAYSISTNVRELEGALISLLAQSSLNKKEITIELAKKMIEKYVKNTTREVTIDYIQKIVADYFNISVDNLLSKSRKREVVQARQIAMYFSKKLTKHSLASIGLQTGSKDHATVLHACKTVNDLMETDKQFKKYVSEIDKKIKFYSP
jgi:chromosomal replication initiator protein